MQLLGSISLTLSLISAVVGAPIVEERQQTTPVQAITNSLNILKADASTDEDALTSAIVNAQHNANAALSIAATVNADLKAIANGFVTAAGAIAAGLANTGTGIAGQVQALTQAELDDLAADLQTLAGVIAGVGATITFEVTNLGPSARAAVSAETDVVKAAIAPVVNPIMVFADAVSKASAKAGATVTGVAGAYTGVQAVVQRFAATNGLPGVSFPGYVSA